VKGLKQWYTYPVDELGLSLLEQYRCSLHDIAKLLELDLKELVK
jgi:hypothetical protein